MRHIYVIGCGNRIKIGYSNDPDKRLKQLQTGASDQMVLEWVQERADAHKLEKHLHRTFSKHKIFGEWFNADTLSIQEIRSAAFGYLVYDWD